MRAHRTFVIASFLALLLPAVLPLIAELRLAQRDSTEVLIREAGMYCLLVLPQALVIAVAWFRSHLRGRFAHVFLVSTTAVLLAFEAVVTFGSDPNGSIIFGFYPIVPLVMLLIALYVTPENSRAAKS